MNISCFNRLLGVSAATLLAATFASAQTQPSSPAWSGDIVYSANFNVAESAAAGPFSIGYTSWASYSGDTGTYFTGNGNNGQTSGGAGTGNGYINKGTAENPEWVYAGPIIPGALRRGFLQSALAAGTTSNSNRFFVDNTTLNLDLSQGQYQISFDAVISSTNTLTDLSVALRIGDQWYVSTTTFQPQAVGNLNTFSSGTYADYHKVLTLTGDAADWLSLTLVADETMALGGQAGSALDLSNVTGIGIFSAKTHGDGGSLRLDSLVVTQVPEPATVTALLAAGALVAVATLRRRRAA